jgi:hypothetical protein
MIEFLEPWKAVNDQSHGVAELNREISAGHVLTGVPFESIGFRQDCDDVAFRLLDGSGRIAVVHLTFQIEHDPKWPFTELFASLEEFVTRIQADHDEFFM